MIFTEGASKEAFEVFSIVAGVHDLSGFLELMKFVNLDAKLHRLCSFTALYSNTHYNSRQITTSLFFH